MPCSLLCRGCTCVEQSVLGGVAHLLNFDGTDTLSAAYYVQFALNGGRPVGVSIPATEHSVMTAWPSGMASGTGLPQMVESCSWGCRHAYGCRQSQREVRMEQPLPASLQNLVVPCCCAVPAVPAVRRCAVLRVLCG